MDIKGFLKNNPRRLSKAVLITATVVLVAAVVWTVSGFRAAERSPDVTYKNGGLLTITVREQSLDPVIAVGQIYISGDCRDIEDVNSGPSRVVQTTVRGSASCTMVRDPSSLKSYFEIDEIIFSSYRANRSYIIPTTDTGQISSLVVPGEGATIAVTISSDGIVSSSITQK